MTRLAALGASLFALTLALSSQAALAVQDESTEVSANTPPAASASAQGSEQSGPNRRFTGADLFDLSIAADPQISPDGRRIAYVRKSNDIMTDRARSSIWLIDTATGSEIPITGMMNDAFSPRWSPDGKRLAFVSTEGGSAQMWVRWIDAGESVRLTGLPSSPGSIAWSPDGNSIAYSMMVEDSGLQLGSQPEGKPEGAEWAEPLEIHDLVTYRADGAGYLKPGFEKIFLVPATGGAPRQLTFGPYHDGGPLSWSRDGRTIYFAANRSADWQTDPR